jgi:hypothetical protein
MNYKYVQNLINAHKQVKLDGKSVFDLARNLTVKEYIFGEFPVSQVAGN